MVNRTIVGCFGSKDAKDSGIADLAYHIGKCALDVNGGEFLTGACPGYPFQFTRGINENRKTDNLNMIIGISPFCNKEEHLRRGLITDFIDIMIYTGLGTDITDNAVAYATRNPINIATVDVGIILPGGNGTISELSMLLEKRKPALVSHGLDSLFDKKVNSIVEDKIREDRLDTAHFSYFSSLSELNEKLERYVEEL